MILAIEYSDGNQKIINVSNNDFSTSGDDGNSDVCCVHGNCSCNSLDQALANLTSNVIVNIKTDMTLSSLVNPSDLVNVLIIGRNNPIVNCGNAGGIQLTICHNCTIQGIVWDGCGSKNTNNNTEPMLKLNNSSNVKIQNCTFQNLMGQAIVLSEVSGEVNFRDCNFVNNSYYRDHGAIIYFVVVSQLSQLLFTISNCNFTLNKGAKSLVYIKNKNSDFSINFHDSNFCHNHGTSIYAVNQRLYFTGKVLFRHNTEHGTAIYITKHSSVIFGENSITPFNNIQNYTNSMGEAVYHSNIKFDQDCFITFQYNSATDGIIYSAVNSNVTFKENCQVTFDNNLVSYGTIYSFNYGHVSFEGNSNTIFSSNSATSGGAIYCDLHGNITFKGASTTVFSNNSADYDGGAIMSLSYGHISFGGTSTTIFRSNTADYGGAILSLHSNVSFEGTSTAKFSNNSAGYDGGAIRSLDFGHISFEGTSTTIFRSNTADYGGAICSAGYEYISFEGTSTTIFGNNSANSGGAINFDNDCRILFEDNSTALFKENNALQGGAMFSRYSSSVSFNGCSTAMFIDNKAADGGVLSCRRCTVLLKGNSTVLLAFNEVIKDGGVMHLTYGSKISFSEFTNVTFKKNSAINGGALFASDNSVICFEGDALVTFTENTAIRNGGAAYFNMYCYITWTQNTNVIFENNNAVFGGAVCLNKYTDATCKNNSTIVFKNNTVISEGGAISILSDSSITLQNSAMIKFNANNALYGGAMFFDRTYTTLTFNNNKTSINFIRNTARIAGNNMYFDVLRSGQNCLNNRSFGVANKTKRHIVTPPNKLELDNPAKCYNNIMEECDQYYLNRLMLGEEITVPVCLRDYCNEPVYSTQRFTLHDFSVPNYVISGRTEFLLSCQSDALRNIRIIGKESLIKSFNYSFNISLNIYGNSNWKQISINLTIQLTPCYPGFWQYLDSQKCECYNANDIIFCSGGYSTIKRGYWFGNVTGLPTVSICPINYCNFTCCETSNGYYQLSPLRDNQCRSHRTGIACGNCIDGYTLPFDSPECVNTDTCTTGQAILVISLTVIFWIIMVILVFAMMYYKVEIGWLYSITYYYSVVDILLSQNLQTSRGLYLTVSIMSSFSKIKPQFLGELCLTTGMSGIDQQFIHYIHPSAVIIFLLMIIALARRSRKISTIVSRGIIHVICLLLLISFTSIAFTSISLMGPLKFHDIDAVYTYLSPDIKYFNGRHLAYGIVALLWTASIVIGLPLLLMLEPFLNHKLNFVKIKPLLDQFQSCYKDKYRFFAGYYMICRLLLIIIIIINPLFEFVVNYLLIAICFMIALIHLMVKPYNNETLNKMDAIVLQIIVLITALPLLGDDLDSPFVLTIAFLLVFLPLITFTAIVLYLHKDHLK